MASGILILVFVGLIVLVLVGLVAYQLALVVLVARMDSQLRRDGVTTEGVVISWKLQKLRRFRGGISALAGFITYRYQADTPGQGRQSFTNTENTWVWVHWKHPIGSHVSVRYLPTDPASSRIAGRASKK